MTARRVTARRDATQQIVAPRTTEARITWGELGCPQEIGLYRAVDGPASMHMHVRVKRIHIIAAENDPHATFTVITLSPPIGPTEYVLGHRVA